MDNKEFRDELVKILPGYRWTVHKTKNQTKLEATGTLSSGFNRLSTIVVSKRKEQGGANWYEAESYGYGTRGRPLFRSFGRTLARALRQLQDCHEAAANTHRSMADRIDSARRKRNTPENVEAVA